MVREDVIVIENHVQKALDSRHRLIEILKRVSVSLSYSTRDYHFCLGLVDNEQTNVPKSYSRIWHWFHKTRRKHIADMGSIKTARKEGSQLRIKVYGQENLPKLSLLARILFSEYELKGVVLSVEEQYAEWEKLESDWDSMD